MHVHGIRLPPADTLCFIRLSSLSVAFYLACPEHDLMAVITGLQLFLSIQWVQKLTWESFQVLRITIPNTHILLRN